MSDQHRHADPLDELFTPLEPTMPDARFVAGLRRRLVDALAVTDDGRPVPDVELPRPATTELPTVAGHEPARTAATSTAPPAPSGLMPYLSVAGAAAAIEWYTEVFGAREQVRYDADDGRIGHAELVIQGAELAIADEYPEYGVRGPLSIGGTPVSLSLAVPDVDAVFAAATAAGARVEREPTDEPYGARTAVIRDPFGHRWLLQTFTSTPSIAEIEAGMPGYTVREPEPEPTPAPGRRQPVELGYFTISTPDTDRAARFYGSLFGWVTEPGNAGDAYRHVANTTLPLGLTPGPTDEPAIMYFRVDDADAFAARVGELGGRVVERAVYDSGPCIMCEDDQGRVFHLWQPAPGY